mmetsp:Transcript_19631/g.31628  ORF Transcript_19631/g.31628 Transcript_19631/m.31628 type:complete len:333 (-) Transcript_19631:232-1230(-)
MNDCVAQLHSQRNFIVHDGTQGHFGKSSSTQGSQMSSRDHSGSHPRYIETHAIFLIGRSRRETKEFVDTESVVRTKPTAIRIAQFQQVSMRRNCFRHPIGICSGGGRLFGWFQFNLSGSRCLCFHIIQRPSTHGASSSASESSSSLAGTLLCLELLDQVELLLNCHLLGVKKGRFATQTTNSCRSSSGPHVLEHHLAQLQLFQRLRRRHSCHASSTAHRRRLTPVLIHPSATSKLTSGISKCLSGFSRLTRTSRNRPTSLGGRVDAFEFGQVDAFNTCQLVFLHVLAGTVATGTVPIAFRLSGPASVATSTQCHTTILVIAVLVVSHGLILG